MRSDLSRPVPFLLHPAAKDYLWGGTRLNDDFAKHVASDVVAETWECSTHPDGVSIAASGEWLGMPLDAILRVHPEYLGEHAHGNTELPVLVKFIDAKRDLSVQVHPSDEFANTHENGQNGKTEMWYVMDAEPDQKRPLFHSARHGSCDRRGQPDRRDTAEFKSYLPSVRLQPCRP